MYYIVCITHTVYTRTEYSPLGYYGTTCVREDTMYTILKLPIVTLEVQFLQSNFFNGV